MAFLLGPSAKQAEMIKQELGEAPGDLERGIRDLMNMCAASPHLPQPDLINNNLLSVFVRGCRMDMERARTKLEAYFVARSRHRDLYEYRSLNEPPLNDTCQFIDIVPLPNLTDEGYRVTIFRIKPNYPGNSADVALAVKAVLLVSECRIHDETLIAGDVFVYEMSEIRGSIVARVAAAFGAFKRAIQLAHAAYPQRLKRIHVVGPPPFLAATLQLVRNCVNERVRKRFYIHAKVDELLDHIPARVLPGEWGGAEESIDTIANKWKRRVDELRDYIRSLNELSNLSAATLNNSDIYSTVGAFKKLDID